MMGVVGGICRLGRWGGCLGDMSHRASAARLGICRIYHTEPPVVDNSVDNYGSGGDMSPLAHSRGVIRRA